MKSLFFLVPAIIFVLSGCSTTHNIADYSSDKEFYEDYNNSAWKKNIKLTLQNDSTVYQYNDTEIKNDTLYAFEKAVDEKHYELPTNSIKNIHYLTNDYKTASLILNDGDRLKGENLFITKDSISFLGIREQTLKIAVSSVNNIKMISYRNPWKGVIPGLFAGVLLGGVLGTTGWIYHPMDGGNTETFNQAEATFLGAMVGFLVGPVVGYIIGFNINYQFSP